MFVVIMTTLHEDGRGFRNRLRFPTLKEAENFCAMNSHTHGSGVHALEQRCDIFVQVHTHTSVGSLLLPLRDLRRIAQQVNDAADDCDKELSKHKPKLATTVRSIDSFAQSQLDRMEDEDE